MFSYIKFIIFVVFVFIRPSVEFGGFCLGFYQFARTFIFFLNGFFIRFESG